MKYVACYCRVSTDEQAKFGFSIEAQRDSLEKYCKENNYKYDFYIDEGISASSMKKRKALNDMLEKSNVYDMILFTKLDRLSRNVLDANNINKMLIENKCTMKAIDEDDIDTSTADGTFIFNLKVSLAQREIGKTSERIKFVFENKRHKGEITSGTRKYGYDIVDKKYIINKEESIKIINLYKYYIKMNGNVTETYKYFIQNFTGKGKDAMSKYLRDTSYIGKYKLYRKNIYIDDYIPRIMEDDLFYAAQRLHKRRSLTQSKKSVIALFSGIVICDRCKGRMSKCQDNRTKKEVIRYACHNSWTKKVGSIQNKCNNSTTIREEKIEDYLLDNIKRLADRQIKLNIVEKPKTDNTKKIKAINDKIEKLKDLYLDDLIDKEQYKKDYKNFTSQLELLKVEKDIPKKDYSNLQKLINSDIETIYYSLNKEEKRTFWLNILNSISVYNGEIKEISFL